MSAEARIASAWAKAVPPASFRTSEAKEEEDEVLSDMASYITSRGSNP